MYSTIIIGSGISGLFVLKELKEKGFNNVLIIDKNPQPYGCWNINNHPSVLKNTYSVSSKLYMTISDHPMPKKMPEFPHHSQILNYYKSYVEKYDLLKHIKNNKKVLKASKKSNYCDIKTNRGDYTCKNLVVATGTTNSC